MSIADALAPRQYRGTELLDDPAADAALAARTLRDIARSNRWFGGASAVLAELAPAIAGAGTAPGPLTLLDVGTGAGDIPEVARHMARRGGVELLTVGLEVTLTRASASRARSGHAVAGSALALPFADRSVDVVACSQLLHHFVAEDGATIIAEMHRVARRRVIIADIRRAWVAAAGFWAGSWAMGFHPVTRHDGVVSIRRGYRTRELSAAVFKATGCRPEVRNRRGFRVTASWSPS